MGKRFAFLKNIDYKRCAAVVITACGVVLALYVAFTRLLGILLPFLIAYGLAVLLRPATRRLSGWLHCPPRVMGPVLMLLSLCSLGALLIYGGRQLGIEASELLSRLSEHPELLQNAADRINRYLEHTIGALPFGRAAVAPVEAGESYLGGMISGATGRMMNALPEWIGGIASALPQFFLFTVVMLIAAFYFSIDPGIGVRAVDALLPPRARAVFARFRRVTASALSVYVRSYLSLMVLTFLLLLCGFLVLRVRYALLVAFLFAVIDLLPVIGVGALLTPWGIFCLLSGNVRLGAGLLILYAVIAVVRQFAEPRMIGDGFGLHPLLVLLAMYAGARLLGLAGMILGPLFAVLLLGMLRADEREEKENAPAAAADAKETKTPPSRDGV